MSQPDRYVFGWKEFVTLPEWDLRLRAKLDTGARTSALHVRDINLGGAAEADVGDQVQFDVVLGTKATPEHHPVSAEIVGFTTVRDSGARAERRPIVRTRLHLGALRLVTDITLTDRSGMNFRMLIGRRTLRGACLVDPTHGYLAGRTTDANTPR
ncbi:MAG: RimK/LysX family protein [Nitriliruptoraceae bacterium]